MSSDNVPPPMNDDNTRHRGPPAVLVQPIEVIDDEACPDVIADADAGVNNNAIVSYVSNSNISILPKDCIALILAEIDEPLTPRIAKAFLCQTFADAVKDLLKSAPRTSVKLFDQERNLSYYRDTLVRDWKMNKADGRFMLFEKFADIEPKSLYRRVYNRNYALIPNHLGTLIRDDHIILRQFTNLSIEEITSMLSYLLPQVTMMVIDTMNIDQVAMLQGFKQLTTLTFIELPDSSQLQRDIWNQLATMTELRHLHIFYRQSDQQIEQNKIAPIMAKLVSFSLINYKHDNLLHIIGMLSPTACRSLRTGPFCCSLDSYQFIEAAKVAYLELMASIAECILKPAEKRHYECANETVHRIHQLPAEWRDPVLSSHAQLLEQNAEQQRATRLERVGRIIIPIILELDPEQGFVNREIEREQHRRVQAFLERYRTIRPRQRINLHEQNRAIDFGERIATNRDDDAVVVAIDSE